LHLYIPTHVLYIITSTIWHPTYIAPLHSNTLHILHLYILTTQILYGDIIYIPTPYVYLIYEYSDTLHTLHLYRFWHPTDTATLHSDNTYIVWGHMWTFKGALKMSTYYIRVVRMLKMSTYIPKSLLSTYWEFVKIRIKFLNIRIHFESENILKNEYILNTHIHLIYLHIFPDF